MPHILISYRRHDSDAIAGRIRDRVAGQFGEDSVFMDIDSIPFGLDFREQVQEALQQNDAMVLAIIGPKWTGIGSGDSSRIMEENDPVRVEVETAIARGIPVIPVLVGEATMPKPSELPDTLKELSFRNAAEVSAGRDFNQHIERLLRSIDRILELEVGRRTRHAQPVVRTVTTPNGRALGRPVPPVSPERTPVLPAGPLIEQIGLRFADRGLEDAFIEAFREQFYAIGQISMISGIVAWIVLGASDLLSGTEGLQSTQFRFMVAAPLLLTFFALSFTRPARRHWQRFFAVFAVVGIACMYIALILIGRESWFRVEQATMSFMLFLALVGLAPFTTVYTAAVGLFIVIVHAYHVASYPDVPALHALFYSLFVVAAYVIACIGAWTRESSLRAAFLAKGKFVFPGARKQRVPDD